MCLRHPNKIEIDKDTICYKVVTKKLTGELVSPYMASKYPLGKTKKLQRSEPIFKWDNFHDYEIIEGGAYHTFKKYKDAKKYAIADGWNGVVIQCIIPKNTKFIYEGWYDTYVGMFPSYASEKVKPVKIMK